MSAQKKYVPPNRRSIPNKKKSPNAQVNVESVSEFPELGAMKSGTMSSYKNENNKNTKMSYAIATREEEPIEQEYENEVSPGWVKLSHESGIKITREYGAHTYQGQDMPEAQEQQTKWGLTRTQSNELKRMVNRWQTDRDLMNDYLDQNSPYWGMKHVDDPLSEDDLESEVGSECSIGDEHSDENDDMDYGDY